MPFSIEADKTLVWDNQQAKMVIKIRVLVRLLGNSGSLFAEKGPLYVETPQEISQAVHLLKARLIQSLPGIS
jgi:hypothetical protein